MLCNKSINLPIVKQLKYSDDTIPLLANIDNSNIDNVKNIKI